MVDLLRNFFNKQIFGVCSWWAERLGIKASFIRLFFIYATFSNALTILIYLFMIFLLRISQHLKYRKRKSVFDL
ncbi:MAG: PspC domain-containing protein [Bacteroidota bacterium]|nr:PspC domain-containing protein [Bacteroidota bacterium]